MTSQPLRILYFGVQSPDKSMRDAPYIAGLKEKGATILECWDSASGFAKFRNLIRKHRTLKGQYDIVFVGHTSTTVVPLARFLSRKPIVFNGMNPLYDGMVLERETYRWYSPSALFVWLLDFLSYASSTVVLLETERQCEYVHEHFFIRRNKLIRVFTTTDPATYKPNPAIPKSPEFLCAFRGFVTPATGVEFIIEAARILKDKEVKFRLLVRGYTAPIKMLIETYQLKNVELLDRHFDPKELEQLILPAQVYLGQFSTHERLDKTIQFKTVEACAYGLPYITADMPSNRELLHDGVDALLVKRADARALADAILKLKADSALREQLGNNAHELYKKVLAPTVIAEQLLSIMRPLV